MMCNLHLSSIFMKNLCAAYKLERMHHPNSVVGSLCYLVN